MPRGIANIYSTLSREELFSIIEQAFNQKKILLEYPNTDTVKVWDANGDEIKTDRQEVISMLKEECLVQFWWNETEDVSMTFYQYHDLTYCQIYLDGLEDVQLIEIMDALMTILFGKNKNDIRGIVFDRSEITEDIELHRFFNDDLFLERLSDGINGLRLLSTKQLQDESYSKLGGLIDDNVYIILNQNKSSIVLYELQKE